jgi:hypothetical protein
MLKVISFSLWGDNPKYNVGAVRNTEIALDLYSDWECHYYIASDVPRDTIDTLFSFPNTKLFIKESSEPCNWLSAFWRFEAAYKKNIDISIFRDTDSRLNHREKAAVDQWLQSNKTFHIMRDHPYHGFCMLAGMWGCKNYQSQYYDIKAMLDSFDKQDKYGSEYDFFANVLYPAIKNDSLVHDPFFEKKPFPTPRIDRGFVGEVFDEKDTRHPQHYLCISDND